MILVARASFVLTGYFTDLSDRMGALAMNLSSGSMSLLDTRGDANTQERKVIVKRRMEIIDDFMFSRDW